MSAQHIGQHSPALRTKPQDQQGQSCFLFAPNSDLLSFNKGQSSLKNIELFASIFSKRIYHIFSSDTQPFGPTQLWPRQSSPALALSALWMSCFWCWLVWAWAVPSGLLRTITGHQAVGMWVIIRFLMHRTFWTSFCPHWTSQSWGPSPGPPLPIRSHQSTCWSCTTDLPMTALQCPQPTLCAVSRMKVQICFASHYTNLVKYCMENDRDHIWHSNDLIIKKNIPSIYGNQSNANVKV